MTIMDTFQILYVVDYLLIYSLTVLRLCKTVLLFLNVSILCVFRVRSLKAFSTHFALHQLVRSA